MLNKQLPQQWQQKLYRFISTAGKKKPAGVWGLEPPFHSPPSGTGWRRWEEREGPEEPHGWSFHLNKEQKRIIRH